MDSVIHEGLDVLPVEVKAARGGTLRSVLQFLGEKRGAKAVRRYMGTPGVEILKMPGAPSASVEVLSLPLYLAGQVRRLAAEFRSGIGFWCTLRESGWSTAPVRSARRRISGVSARLPAAAITNGTMR